MSVYVCSLILNEPQSIPADGGYHIVRFPCDVSGESYDAHGMHEAVQPDGYQVTVTSYSLTPSCRYIAGLQRVDIPVVQKWLATFGVAPGS